MEKLFPDEKIIVTKYFDVHQDWFVPIPGFFILANIRKANSILDFTEEEMQELTGLVQKIRKGMKEVLGIKYVYFAQNEATEYGIFHIWMFPWYSWMEKFGPKKMQTIPLIMAHAKEHMLSETDLELVREFAQKMREYLKKS